MFWLFYDKINKQPFPHDYLKIDPQFYSFIGKQTNMSKKTKGTSLFNYFWAILIGLVYFFDKQFLWFCY